MALPIISADERLAQRKGIKGCIFGRSGIGKTSLAAEFPEPVFIQTEEGTGNLELTTFADGVNPGDKLVHGNGLIP